MLINLYEYNQWANGRILEQAEKVAEEQWTDRRDAEGRSLQEILAHSLRTERVWRLLSAHGMIREGDLPEMEELGTVEALREFGETESELIQVLLRDWSDDSFDEDVLVTRWDGKTYPLTRWKMLHHCLMHSMQHRSEAALLLTEYGHSPGDIDYLFFI
jgi:uncharacterized damage-inducible protein DinB